MPIVLRRKLRIKKGNKAWKALGPVLAFRMRLPPRVGALRLAL